MDSVQLINNKRREFDRMKIETKNNWEVRTYFFKDVELTKAPGKAYVKDGVLLFKPEDIVAKYYDMGHAYDVNTYKFVTEIPFNNQKLKINLEELDIIKIVQ